jgi:Protein of unknown function C-terminus (DUF2399)
MGGSKLAAADPAALACRVKPLVRSWHPGSGCSPVLGAIWAPTLTPAMPELGVKVEEERVLDDLLADLAEP